MKISILAFCACFDDDVYCACFDIAAVRFHFIAAADINADGDVSNADRALLSNNWLGEVGDDDLIYPQPLAADIVFAGFESADLETDLDVF